MRTVCGTDGGLASAPERGGAWRDAAVAGIHWAGQAKPPRLAPPPHIAHGVTDPSSTRGETLNASSHTSEDITCETNQQIIH